MGLRALWAKLIKWYEIYWWDNMEAELVRVDRKGRVLIPKRLRERVGLREGWYARVRAQGRRLVIEPVEPVADKYYGVFRVERWPEDLDEFLAEVVGKWWREKST